VGKRLSRLSESTNRVLSVASVIGREFQLDVLRQVLPYTDEELEAALEESSAAGIIEEHSVVGMTITYHFSHAFFRQTLYDEIVAPRRMRLHQQVAHALEEVHRRRLDEHAAQVAEHYAFSSDSLDLAKAVHYGEVAARRATDVFAYGEATRQVDRALIAHARTLIGRLAVDRDFAGQGFGTLLLMDALHRSLEQSQHMGAIAVVVDAKDNQARSFYERHDFKRLLDHEYRLYLPMKTIEQLF
jgi:predicted ATPase